MRVHLLGLPHTETTKMYSWCAYTQKIRKLCNMLTEKGHEVILYAGEENEGLVTEHVPIVDRAWQQYHFGHYDWSHDVFNGFDSSTAWWQQFNARSIKAIRRRMKPGDVLGITMGLSQKPVADALPELYQVEVGIGYEGVFSPYRVFESYAWMHHLAAKGGINDVRFYDTVIPNSFDAEDFPMGSGKGLYYLFIGRFIKRKGIEIAVETTKRIGAQLLIAGQGASYQGNGRWTGIDVEIQGDHITHVGVVGPEKRAELMGSAIATFVPTLYLEPFGGVSVESMLCGTPVITTDYGAFTETVQRNVTGFRCHTLGEFMAAAEAVKFLNRSEIYKYAHERYTTTVIANQYDQYLRRLGTLARNGWYEEEF